MQTDALALLAYLGERVRFHSAPCLICSFETMGLWELQSSLQMDE